MRAEPAAHTCWPRLGAARVIPTRARKLKGLAAGMYKSERDKLVEAQSAEEREMNDYIDRLQHWHFEPANPRARAGEFQACEVDRLLSHNEEYAHILDLPPDRLVTRDAWLEALELPEASPMRRNARFLRVLDELCEPKYPAEKKEQFVDALRFGMMLDPKRAGYPEGLGHPEEPAWSAAETRFIYGSSAEAAHADFLRRFPHLEKKA